MKHDYQDTDMTLNGKPMVICVKCGMCQNLERETECRGYWQTLHPRIGLSVGSNVVEQVSIRTDK